jgi:L-seryl-tRNA(Ser) seleniumtransferase
MGHQATCRRCLLARAQVMAERLVEAAVDAVVVESAAVVGGGGAPGVELPSAAVSLPERFAAALRTGAVPVVGCTEGGRYLLDLRTVDPGEDEAVLRAVLACT